MNIYSTVIVFFRACSTVIALMPLWRIGLLCLLFALRANAHGVHHKVSEFSDDPRALVTLDWHRPGIARVVTAGYPDSFGLFAFNGRKPSEIVTVGNKQCLKANFLAFDVDDEQAFDTPLNTRLRLRLQVATKQSGQLIMAYDGHGTINAYQIIDEQHLLQQPHQPSPQTKNQDLSWYDLTLPNARLLNRGMAATDLALTTLETMKYPEDILPGDNTQLVLCDIQIADMPLTSVQKAKTSVDLRLHFLSENGKNTPVRFALYDASGSQMIASEGTLAVPYYEDEVRVLSLRDGLNPEQFWPHQNRYYQYSGGTVGFALSPGEYQLVASKGPEYQLVLTAIQVTAVKQQNHKIELKRFSNWQKKGWYSGDVHVHMNRYFGDQINLLNVAQAEDLHLTNLLTMSNIGGDHYAQPQYVKQGRAHRQAGIMFNALVPGVEAPRTAFRGHGLSLNINSLTLNDAKKDADYFLYHKYFTAYQQQGGVNGYAHIGSEEFNGSWGLALDVPFGLVDFAEIMQNSRLRTQIWYEHLHIGHRIAPAAGSDFPYFDQPGAVRTYVHNEGSSLDKTDAWFAGLKAGSVFVSNGPLVNFRLDDVLPGGELAFKSSYKMALEVALNPELDHIQSVEIIHCGETVYSQEHLEHKIAAGHLAVTMPVTFPSSGWVAIKITGEDQALAHTGAIYINNHNDLSTCPNQYHATLNAMLTRLDLLAQSVPNASRELEYWASQALLSQYHEQSEQLERRIELARQYYKHKLSIAQATLVNDSRKRGNP